MAITLPTGTPSEGDTFSHGGFEYVWRGDRWDSAGFIGLDPGAGQLEFLASYANMPATLPAFSGNTSFHARNPWKGTGAGTATSATDGWIELRSGTQSSGGTSTLALSNNGGILFPENLIEYLGTATNISDIDSNDAANVLIGDTYYRCSWSSTSPGSFSKQFGSNANQGLVNQIGLTNYANIDDFTDWTSVIGFEFKVPSGNTAGAAAGSTIRIRRIDTVQATQQLSGISGVSGTITNNYYMFRWEHFSDTFVQGALAPSS